MLRLFTSLVALTSIDQRITCEGALSTCKKTTGTKDMTLFAREGERAGEKSRGAGSMAAGGERGARGGGGSEWVNERWRGEGEREK